MRNLQILLLSLMGLMLGACQQTPEAVVEEEGIPVVCIVGKAEAFYIANGPRFSNIDALIGYLKQNYDRIILRETDTPVPFAEKLASIFSGNGISVEKYVYLYPPPEPEKEPAEVLTFEL
jgi:hypothetical protein